MKNVREILSEDAKLREVFEFGFRQVAFVESRERVREACGLEMEGRRCWVQVSDKRSAKKVCRIMEALSLVEKAEEGSGSRSESLRITGSIRI